MPERELSAPGQCQASQPEEPPGHHVVIGQKQAQRQIRHYVIKRLMEGVQGLEAAQSKAHSSQCRACSADL